MNAARLPITINGQTYAQGLVAMRRAVKAGEKVAGYWLRLRAGVRLQDTDGAPFAFIALRPNGNSWFVSVSQPPALCGRIWYMFGLTNIDIRRLGFDDSGSTDRAEHEAAESVRNQLARMDAATAPETAARKAA